MTYDELLRLETITRRAFNAARQFADNETHTQFRNIEFLLAEIRFAGEWLCDPDATEQERKDATERLVSVFGIDLR